MRLYFAALENDKPGQRVFDVKLQDKTVLKRLRHGHQHRRRKKAHVAEFNDIPVTTSLVIELTPAQARADADHQPILSGIEVLRTNAKEIREQVAGR